MSLVSVLAEAASGAITEPAQCLAGSLYTSLGLRGSLEVSFRARKCCLEQGDKQTPIRVRTWDHRGGLKAFSYPHSCDLDEKAQLTTAPECCAKETCTKWCWSPLSLKLNITAKGGLHTSQLSQAELSSHARGSLLSSTSSPQYSRDSLQLSLHPPRLCQCWRGLAQLQAHILENRW